MMDESIMKSELGMLDGIDSILEAIKNHEIDIYAYLADIVASLCNIEKDEMLGKSEKAYIAHARWLFWYSYRYMSGETFEKISDMTVRCGGGKFTGNGIGQCVNRMSSLIESQPIWQRRWKIVKKVIKAADSEDQSLKESTIVISVPKELRDKVKITVKEK